MINHLWQAFYTKDLKQLKRRRKTDIQSEEPTQEIQRQVSDPVDLSQTYDSIRRRSSQMPAPPASTTTPEKSNNGYGPLTATNQHYRSSLIAAGRPSSLSTLTEGDV